MDTINDKEIAGFEYITIDSTDFRRGKIDGLCIKPGKWRPGFLGSIRNLFQSEWSEIEDCEHHEFNLVQPLPNSIHAFRKRMNAFSFLSVVKGQILIVLIENRNDRHVIVERLIGFDSPAANILVPPGVYVGWKSISENTLVVEGWIGQNNESSLMSWKAQGEKVWEVQV